MRVYAPQKREISCSTAFFFLFDLFVCLLIYFIFLILVTSYIFLFSFFIYFFVSLHSDGGVGGIDGDAGVVKSSKKFFPMNRG